MFPEDIEHWLTERFSEPERARSALAPLANSEMNKQLERIIRCVLSLSESDYDSVAGWSKKAVNDPEQVIGLAEYDNREVRKYNFEYSLYSQEPYSYGD